MSAPTSGKPPADEDIEIEIDEDYSDVEIEEEKEEQKMADDKAQSLAPRPATPHAPTTTPLITRAATPPISHNATAPTSSLASLDVPSASSSGSSQQNASSLPQPLPSASSSTPSTAASRHVTPADATRTSDSLLSSTAASGPIATQLHDSQAGNLSAVHHFSAPLQLGHGSSTSSSSFSLSSTADRQQQLTSSQLDHLVEALNADNARLLLQIKQRDAHIEQLTQQHNRDKKRLRDECEQARHELAIAQSSKRTAMEGEGEAGKELARMREEWEKERMAWKDRENQLLYEVNRVSATSTGTQLAAPTSPSLRSSASPRPVPLDDRSVSIAELQQLLRDRESQLHQQADKLAWYAENQQLLSDSQSALDHAHARIKQLERQIHTTSPTKGRGGSAAMPTPSEPRSLPADTKHIKQLEKEIQQLRRRLATPAVAAGADREDVAMAGLIEAVKGGEEGEVVRELRGRVKELEEEMQTREEEWERRLRAMRQEQDKIRVGFEKKVRVLQEGVKGRLAQLKGKKRLSAVGASGGEVVGVVGGVDEVVKAMEARMEEMRERYEKMIEEMQSAAGVQSKHSQNKHHLSPASPPRPSSVGSTAARTPLRSALRSALRPTRSASTPRLHSLARPQPAAAQHSNPEPAASVVDVSQPSSPRARSAATTTTSRAHQTHHQPHSHTLPSVTAASVGSADLDAHFQQLHTLLQSSHRSDLTALSTHYTQLLTTLQHHTRTQLDTMQQRLTATESERQHLADAVTQLQSDVWKREREAEEKGWEVERWRERPGVKEYVLLERQVRDMEARMERREKEYREAVEMAELRAEEERVRLVDRFEGIVKRKNDQIRSFEHEMEQLIDLLHKTQQQLQQHHKRSTTAATSSREAALRELGEREVVSGSMDGGAAVGVVNYVALLDRLEQQQSAVYQQLTASNKGKENKARVSLTAKSAVGKPIMGGGSGAIPVAQSDKTAFRRTTISAGSVKRAPFAPQPATRRAQ